MAGIRGKAGKDGGDDRKPWQDRTAGMRRIFARKG
jgi:hypothetical protein